MKTSHSMRAALALTAVSLALGIGAAAPAQAATSAGASAGVSAPAAMSEDAQVNLIGRHVLATKGVREANMWVSVISRETKIVEKQYRKAQDGHRGAVAAQKKLPKSASAVKKAAVKASVKEATTALAMAKENLSRHREAGRAVAADLVKAKAHAETVRAEVVAEFGTDQGVAGYGTDEQRETVTRALADVKDFIRDGQVETRAAAKRLATAEKRHTTASHDVAKAVKAYHALPKKTSAAKRQAALDKVTIARSKQSTAKAVRSNAREDVRQIAVDVKLWNQWQQILLSAGNDLSDGTALT